MTSAVLAPTPTLLLPPISVATLTLSLRDLAAKPPNGTGGTTLVGLCGVCVVSALRAWMPVYVWVGTMAESVAVCMANACSRV